MEVFLQYFSSTTDK